jgi:hypothetical protein
MHPRGCQETVGHETRADLPAANYRFQKGLRRRFPLTLPKSGTYTDSVKSRHTLALLLVGAAIVLHPQALPAQAIQRSIYVSVVDETGAPVPDLAPSDVIVREDNVAREVLRIAPADQPMQIVVMVDNSTAAKDYIRDIRVGVEGFITDVTNGTKNEVSIVALAERPTILANPSNDRAQIMKGVNRIFEQPTSGNYLLDGVIEVCRGFVKREAERPVIVAITTEGPEFSSRRYEDVLKPLQDVGAAFHVIVLGPPANDISEDARNRSAVLDQGPSTTGGARESLLTGSALPGSLKRLATELKHQYHVTYARPQSLVPPERTTVSAAKPKLVARGTPIKEKRDRAKK